MRGPAQEAGVVVVLDGLDANLFEEIIGLDGWCIMLLRLVFYT